MSENNEQPKTESHDPKVPEAWAKFMREGWGDRELDLPPHPVADWAAARRKKLAETFDSNVTPQENKGFFDKVKDLLG